MTLETLLLLCWLKACAVTYHLPAEFVKAVADVESNVTKGFRTGPLNKKKTFIGPMGIYTGCEKVTGNIYNPFDNIRIATESLVRLGATSNPTTWRRALKKYNAEFNNAYYQSVLRRYRYYKKRGLE